MLNINLLTPSMMQEEIKHKFKQKRLSLNLTQEGLANKSGVSLGSLKRFESSGQIAFESLLKLSLVLECLDDFRGIANPKDEIINSIDDLIKESVNHRKRGSIK